MTSSQNKRINAVLIAGGVWHDIDFARLEILKLLAEDERVRVRVFEDFEDAIKSLDDADILVTYTCNVRPSEDAQKVLKSYLNKGKRWYALHGTNSILEMLTPNKKYGKGELNVNAPDLAPEFMDMLGSRFIAHPPIEPYTVQITQPGHALVKDIEPFETTDELYLMETSGDLNVLMHTEFEGEAPGFVVKNWEKANHPVFYTHKVGKGEVLYLTLGHCRGHYDMSDFMEYYPTVERCAWDLDVFYELLRRGLKWAKEPLFSS